MKLFVAIAFVALISGSLIEARVARDLKSDLITRGNALLTRASTAVRELEHLHNVHEAALIRSEEARVKSLISELELATSTSLIAHLEAELTRAEQALTRELERIHRVPVPVIDPIRPHVPAKRDVKSDLIARGNALLVRAAETVRAHPHEAAVLRTSEERVRRLVHELELVSAPINIAALERELTAAEAHLSAELERIHRVPAKRDVKSDLIARGNALLVRAAETVRSHPHEASVIRVTESRVRQLIHELELATAATTVATLERELTAAEAHLSAELERIHRVVILPHVDPIRHIPAKRDVKSDLIARGNALLVRAAETTRTHPHEAAVIRVTESRVRQLVHELELATGTTTVATLERELTAAEAHLTAELERIHRVPILPHIPAKRDVKSDLIARGNALLVRAAETVRSHPHEAAVLRTSEERVRRLVHELELVSAPINIAALERELTTAEAHLSAELERIHRVPAKRDVKSDLIARGNALLVRAAETVRAHPHEAAVLRTSEERVRRLVHELELVASPINIAALERELTAAEAHLSAELERIHRIPA